MLRNRAARFDEALDPDLSLSIAAPPGADTAAVIRASRALAELPQGYEHYALLLRAPSEGARALLWGPYLLDAAGWGRLLQRAAALLEADGALAARAGRHSAADVAVAIRRAERDLRDPRSLTRPEARALLALLRDPDTEDRALDFIRALYGDAAPDAAWRLTVLAAAHRRCRTLIA